MDLLISFLIVVLLLYITYQDIKYRAVPWIVFPIIAMLIILKNIYIDRWVFLQSLVLNILFVLVQLLMLTLYFSLKQKQFVKIWEHLIGEGDILFFLILALIFSPVNFIAFYLLSLILVVLFVLLIRSLKPKYNLIPLAGLQSFLLAFLIAGNLVFHLSLTDDVLILNYINLWTN